MSSGQDDEGPLVIDGGDRACGELLLQLAGQLRGMRAGTVVRLVATDPAAPVDVPAWCHLTGHRYLVAGRQPDGRPHYDVVLSGQARSTDPHRPWRLVTADPDHTAVRPNES